MSGFFFRIMVSVEGRKRHTGVWHIIPKCLLHTGPPPQQELQSDPYIYNDYYNGHEHDIQQQSKGIFKIGSSLEMCKNIR